MPLFFRIVISFHAHFEFLALLFFLERKIWIAAVFFFFCGSVVIVSKGQFCSLDSFSRPKNLRENSLSVQNADCRLQTGCKMQTENLNCFFVWYVITCRLTSYRESRNRFSAIIFHDHLHLWNIPCRFLIHFVFDKAAIAFWFLTKRPQTFLMELQAFVLSNN